MSAHALQTFGHWFAQPLSTRTMTVAETLEMLAGHPMSDDETACDYFMPPARCHEQPGRFRIYGENQDVWYFFVYRGDEDRINPPVYFETSLDLRIDHGIKESQIINGDHILACDRFQDFLWQMLAQQICLRMDHSEILAEGVNGIVTSSRLNVDVSYSTYPDQELPPGNQCFLFRDVICCPYWGAAFRTTESREDFIRSQNPEIRYRWG